jgi:hypothetical protein
LCIDPDECLEDRFGNPKDNELYLSGQNYCFPIDWNNNDRGKLVMRYSKLRNSDITDLLEMNRGL